MPSRHQESRHGLTSHGTHKRSLHLQEDDLRRLEAIKSRMATTPEFADLITDTAVFRYCLKFTDDHTAKPRQTR